MPDTLPGVLTWPVLPALPGQPITLLQLTDLHLCESAQASLLGVPVESSFRAVLAQACQDFPDANACVLTGDLSDDGSEAAYQRLAAHTQSLPWPVMWLPGNHDDAATLQRVAAHQGEWGAVRCFAAGVWRVILLDSSVPGEVGGALGEAEYRWLELALMDSHDCPVLVVMHHPACDSGTRWIDGQQLADGERFWRVLARYPNVRALLCGHIHQDIDRMVNGLRWLASPSTCVQFMPGAGVFQLDTASPGYRWLVLKPDGSLDSGVHRLPAGAFPVSGNHGEAYS